MNALKRGVLELVIAGLLGGTCSAECLSPEYLAVAPNGKTLYVTGATSGKLLLFSVIDRKVVGEWTLPCNPSGVAVAADGTVYVSGGGLDGVLYQLSAAGKILAKVKTGHTPISPVIAQDGATVYVLNRFNNNVVAVDAVEMKVTHTVAVLREPHAAVLGAGGKLLFVANHLPASRSTDNTVGAAVSVIDTATLKLFQNVMLPNGSTGMRGIGASPDGGFVYVTHTFGRYQLPATQLERGWMCTAGLSVFNGKTGEYVNTALLDDVDQGAANPWGVTVSPDGKFLIVAHAGTREISVIDRTAFHVRLDKAAKNEKVTDVTTSASDVPNDLAFLVGIRRRVKLGGDGPRGATVVGDTVHVSLYFADALATVNLSDAMLKSRVLPLGATLDPSKDRVRCGEMLWNDATMCFQQWLSCASCHPDGRTDGLNWDLMNDGIGNPKNTRSMLLTQQGGPAMALGVRENSRMAVRAGITHIEFAVRPEENANAIDKYIAALRPVPSPHLIDGRLSQAAERGKMIFYDPKIGCSQCHSEPFYSDSLAHDVGSATELDRPTDKFNTPGLIEAWRSAPYLHDGHYRTMKELVVHGKHGGKDSSVDNLSERQLDDLVEFLLSL
jgi:YVTN family beta-propeller protein